MERGPRGGRADYLSPWVNKETVWKWQKHINTGRGIPLLITDPPLANFVSLFCRLRWLRPFFNVLVILMFFNTVKMRFSKRQAVFNISIS